MNWRFWQSQRDRVIHEMHSEIRDMRKTVRGEYEDAEILELMDEMENLRRTFDRLLEPETPTAGQPGAAPVIPPEALEAALEFVPEGWRGIASLMARRYLNDPAKMREIWAKMAPYMDKLQRGQLPATPQPPTGNQGVLAQAGIPPEYYTGYDPSKPPPRKWPAPQ